MFSWKTSCRVLWGVGFFLVKIERGFIRVFVGLFLIVGVVVDFRFEGGFW